MAGGRGVGEAAGIREWLRLPCGVLCVSMPYSAARSLRSGLRPVRVSDYAVYLWRLRRSCVGKQGLLQDSPGGRGVQARHPQALPSGICREGRLPG